jgi:gamma-glutamyltranspeptidase/glutathione hydrolase
MNHRYAPVQVRVLRWLAVLAVVTVGTAASQDHPHIARSARGMVATAHPLGTDAAVAVFRQGGNAIDAAVAAALTLGVVDGSNSGIGGGCLILIRAADGAVAAIDGRETAPAAAHPEMYLVDGKADTSLSQTGALAAGVPGALAAYARALESFGSKPLAELIGPAARLADDGFPLRAADAARIREAAADFRRFEGSRQVFLDADGQPWPRGHRLRQPDLAETYRGIARDGIDHFYRGPVARKVAEWMAEHGGIMTAADFEAYQARWREPVRSSYRGRTVIGFPPPSSGGIHVAQILSILESFELAAMAPAERVHATAEAMKLAFADRAHWLGDSDFTKVPRGLTDAGYAAGLAARIRMDRASEVAGHGMPPEWEENVFGRHTTHLSVADAAGNWVAITATVNTSFGSKVVVPGNGVILNNEMDDFSIQPGVPNAFGLIGGEANKVEPGKRPLSAMSPTILLDAAGEPFLAIGAAGGPTIISQTVLAIIGVVDLEMSLGEALAQPRFHHQWLPATLRMERRMPAGTAARLEALGHTIQWVERIGVSQGVMRRGGEFIGGHDPRTEGRAAGW